MILCERGIRTFETDDRAITLDLAAVPVLKERTHLPVIVDPSARGRTARAGRAARAGRRRRGADGLIVEFHPDPAQRRCDGPQALTLDALPGFARGCAPWLTWPPARSHSPRASARRCPLVAADRRGGMATAMIASDQAMAVTTGWVRTHGVSGVIAAGLPKSWRRAATTALIGL